MPDSMAAESARRDTRSSRRTFLLISQVYVPDPASVGQHMAGAARELAVRGHRVVVITSARGYDNPSVKYPPRELRDGVEIRRLSLASFGKGSLAVRALGGMLFLFQAVLHGVFLRGLDTVVVTTSPPFSAAAALMIATVRRVRVRYWIMDLNPDQAVAMGKAREHSPAVRLFDALNRRILTRADSVIVLDRFMAERVARKLPAVRSRMVVLPPWPLEDVKMPLAHNVNPFRHTYELQRQFVIMYSGNHSPANPLGTLLAAAERLQNDRELTFLFVGGGIGKREVDASTATNIRSLPYQPMAQLRESLSAADVHIVSIGNEVVGMVHPCKVYGAMAVARPILLLGPADNHVADLLRQEGIGWHLAHGDVDGAVATIRTIRNTPLTELERMGSHAQTVVSKRLGRAALTAALCDVLEGVSRPTASVATS